MVDLKALNEDLVAEHQALDEVLGALPDEDWDIPTPSPGWSVRDQITHLAFFDERAHLAVVDPEVFAESLIHVTDVDSFVNDPLLDARSLPPARVLERWRSARAAMVDAFGGMDPSVRVPWFGPPMSPASFVSARLMETWAHGQDIVDALEVERAPTERLRHIAHLVVRARRNSYVANGREMPAGDIRVTLKGPSGDTWVWNENADAGVTGDALDFCLVVTQRRHLDDTNLVIEGEQAREWMTIAQVFAGPPGEGRRPGQFPRPVA